MRVTRTLATAIPAAAFHQIEGAGDGVTVAWDGYCYGGTMMMREPYLDVYGKLTRGRRHISPERAEHLMRFCAGRGMRLNILAMGLKPASAVTAAKSR